MLGCRPHKPNLGLWSLGYFIWLKAKHSRYGTLMFISQSANEILQVIFFLLNFQINQLDCVFSVVDFEGSFELLKSILKKHSKGKLKGQKLTKKEVKDNYCQLIHCPSSKFKCLRGDLSSEEVCGLLRWLRKNNFERDGEWGKEAERAEAHISWRRQYPHLGMEQKKGDIFYGFDCSKCAYIT